MDWAGFVGRLRESCDVPVARLPAGAILRPKSGPLDVRALLAEFASASDLAAWAEENGDLREEDGLPGNAAVVLGDRWSLVEVVTFEWDSFMTTWFASLDLVDPGDGRQYVTLFTEDAPFRIVAALEPKAHLESFSVFFRTLRWCPASC